MPLRLPNALSVRFDRLATPSPALMRELAPPRRRRRRAYYGKRRKRSA